jgi:hypothetical protein
VSAEDGDLLAGAHVVQVNVVMVSPADGDLLARRAEGVRPILPAWSGQHDLVVDRFIAAVDDGMKVWDWLVAFYR